jgi:Concanavalin A-like lectin/glucanases superfamily
MANARITQNDVETLIPFSTPDADALIQAMMLDSPKALWIFGDVAGATTAYDFVSRQQATYQGGYTLHTPTGLLGPAGYGDLLNGTSGYIQIAAPGWGLTDTFTYEAIVQCTAVGTINERLLDINPSGGPQIFKNNGTLDHWQIESQSGTTISESTSTLGSGLHLLGWTKATTTNHMYQDGTDVTGSVTNAAIAGAAGDVILGKHRSSAGDYFNGSYILFAAYGTALSSARMAAHAAAMKSFTGSLVTQDLIEVLHQSADTYAKLSQRPVEVLYANSSAAARITQDVIEVLYPDLQGL